MRLAIGDLWTGGVTTMTRLKCRPDWCRNLSDRLTTGMTAVVRLVTKQCEFVAAQRMRRACQVSSLYSRLYGDATLRTMVSRFESGRYGRCFFMGKRGIGTLLAAASIFNWDREQITDAEMQRCADDLKFVSEPDTESLKFCTHQVQSDPNSEWEAVIDRDYLKVWRKPVNGYLYEYKVFGSFFDIPARAFFDVQLNIEYRKKWDKLVISLDVVDRHEKTGSEIIHWVMHYPFPMYSRDYVYVRRHHVNPDDRLMILVSKATEHPCCPIDNRFVRVARYSSSMVIKPHGNIDQNGFDYVLTYFDDPKAMIPSPAYNWMASSGVPDFVEKLHRAAIVLHREMVEGDSSSAQCGDDRSDLQLARHVDVVPNQSNQVPSFA